MSPIVAFSKRSALWGVALLLVALAGSTTAKADSITYDITGTFTDYAQPLTLTGEYVWDTDLGTPTSYLFNLTDTTDSASCSAATPGGCLNTIATFYGTGPLGGTIDLVLAFLDPTAPQFTLGLFNADGTPFSEITQTITPTPTTPTVQVPEPAAIFSVLLALIMLAAGMRRAHSLRLVGN
jgi:hypothetical protein